MSVRNGADTIKETIESVLAQTYTNWTLTIRDNCSTDNTVEIIESFFDKRIHVIRNETDMGTLFNFICLALTANGEFIKTIDDDSCLHPECLEKQIEILESRPDIAFVTCDTEYRTPNGKKIPAKIPFKNDVVTRDEYIKFTLLTARGSIQEGNQTLYRLYSFKAAWLKWFAAGLSGGLVNLYSGSFYVPAVVLSTGNLYIIRQTLSSGRLEANSYSLKFNQAKLLPAWIKLLQMDGYKISPPLYFFSRLMIILRASARRFIFWLLGSCKNGG
jgi:glycosyltransferase involved in cell wall biosynthesis